MSEPIDNVPFIVAIAEMLELNEKVASKLEAANANNPDPHKRELVELVAQLLRSNSKLIKNLAEERLMFTDELEKVVDKITKK